MLRLRPVGKFEGGQVGMIERGNLVEQIMLGIQRPDAEAGLPAPVKDRQQIVGHAGDTGRGFGYAMGIALIDDHLFGGMDIGIIVVVAINVRPRDTALLQDRQNGHKIPTQLFHGFDIAAVAVVAAQHDQVRLDAVEHGGKSGNRSGVKRILLLNIRDHKHPKAAGRHGVAAGFWF